jgi:hypothetical protein
MDMYSRIDEYIQGENRRKPMTSDEMMHYYGSNVQRKGAVNRFGAFLSQTLAAFRHRAGLTMPADAANPAPAYRRI